MTVVLHALKMKDANLKIPYAIWGWNWNLLWDININKYHWRLVTHSMIEIITYVLLAGVASACVRRYEGMMQ